LVILRDCGSLDPGSNLGPGLSHFHDGFASSFIYGSVRTYTAQDTLISDSSATLHRGRVLFYSSALRSSPYRDCTTAIPP
jgi:hypothetical protein